MWRASLSQRVRLLLRVELRIQNVRADSCCDTRRRQRAKDQIAKGDVHQTVVLVKVFLNQSLKVLVRARNFHDFEGHRLSKNEDPQERRCSWSSRF